MKNINLLLLGFGNVGKAYAKMLQNKKKDILNKFNYEIKVVGITTGTSGNLINEKGIDLNKIMNFKEKNSKFDNSLKSFTKKSNIEIIKTLDYDVLIEMTPLNIETGQPAIKHIDLAFSRNKHVITANKGPIAWDFKRLNEKALKNNLIFLYETVVMDGTPIFNLVQDTLPMTKILSVNGILNSTTNYVLEQMEKGISQKNAIENGKKLGFVENDHLLDIKGFDAAAKLTSLANVLMNANITPDQIDRKGIEDISIEDVKKAKSNNKIYKLICNLKYENGKVKGTVKPKIFDKNSTYASIDGTTSMISIETDLMGTVEVIEKNPEIKQTAFGVFSDTIRLLKKL